MRRGGAGTTTGIGRRLWQTPKDGSVPDRTMPQAVAETADRSSLAESRTICVGGVAGTSVLGATSLAAVQDLVRETQGRLQDLLPYISIA